MSVKNRLCRRSSVKPCHKNGSETLCLQAEFTSWNKRWNIDYGCQEVETVLKPRPSLLANKLHHRIVCIHPLVSTASVDDTPCRCLVCTAGISKLDTFCNLFYLSGHLLCSLVICVFAVFYYLFFFFSCERTRPLRLKKDPQLCSVTSVKRQLQRCRTCTARPRKNKKNPKKTRKPSKSLVKPQISPGAGL